MSMLTLLGAALVLPAAAAQLQPAAPWPVVCATNRSGLEACWPTCQVRCPAGAACCRTPFAADSEGLGCCASAPNPNREPGCKAGPPRPLATDRPNVVVIGDSVSMGYTPWVAKHLGAALRAYLWPAQSVQSRPKLPRQTAASLSIRPGVRLRSTDDDPDVRHRLRQARYACPALAPWPPCNTRARSVQHRRFGHLFTYPSC